MNNLNESQMLTEELKGLEDVKAIEKLQEDAELMGLDDVVALAKQKVEKLQLEAEEAAAETTVSGVEMATEEQIEDRNTEDLHQREIDKILAEAEKEIGEIEGVPENSNEETEMVDIEPEVINNENINAYIDKIRSGEIDITKNTNDGFIQGGLARKIILSDPQIPLSKKLKFNGVGLDLENPEILSMVMNSSTKEDIIQSAKKGEILPIYVPEEVKKEVFNESYLFNLKKDFKEEINRAFESQSPNEQINTTSIGRIIQAFGSIEQQDVDYFLYLVNEKFKDAPHKQNIVRQVKSVIDSYKERGKII